jgi:hypothetical protein
MLNDAYAFTVESSYAAAHKKAIEENKIMMVFLSERGSNSCNTKLLQIIQNKKITKLIEEKAVFVVIMKDQKESYPIEMLYSRVYPTLFFLDTDELPHCRALHLEITNKEISNCLQSE